MLEVQRSGCRDWDARAGRIALEGPKRRKGSSVPSILKAPPGGGDGLGRRVPGSLVHDNSTWAVDNTVKAMGASGMSVGSAPRSMSG